MPLDDASTAAVEGFLRSSRGRRTLHEHPPGDIQRLGQWYGMRGDCSYARAVRVYVRSEAGQPLWLARYRSGYVCTYGVPLANI